MNSPKKGEKQKGKRFTTQMKWNSFGFDWNAFKIFFMQSFGFSKMNNDFVWTFEYASQTTNRFDTSPQNFKRMNIRRINDTIRSLVRYGMSRCTFAQNRILLNEEQHMYMSMLLPSFACEQNWRQSSPEDVYVWALFWIQLEILYLELNRQSISILTEFSILKVFRSSAWYNFGFYLFFFSLKRRSSNSNFQNCRLETEMIRNCFLYVGTNMFEGFFCLGEPIDSKTAPEQKHVNVKKTFVCGTTFSNRLDGIVIIIFARLNCCPLCGYVNQTHFLFLLLHSFSGIEFWNVFANRIQNVYSNHGPLPFFKWFVPVKYTICACVWVKSYVRECFHFQFFLC